MKEVGLSRAENAGSAAEAGAGAGAGVGAATSAGQRTGDAVEIGKPPQQQPQQQQQQQRTQGGLLEVGVTTRPQGHSLKVGDKPDFSVPSAAGAAPPSALLAKLNAFLPQLAAANEELNDTIAASPAAAKELDVTNCDDVAQDGRVIEMDVTLVPVPKEKEEAWAEQADDM